MPPGQCGSVALRASEGIFDLYNDGQRHTGTIKRGFLKVGMDIFNSDLSKFDNWMDTLATHSVYASLLHVERLE